MIKEDMFQDLMTISGVLSASLYDSSGEELLSKVKQNGEGQVEIGLIGPLAIEMYSKVKEISLRLNTGTPEFISFETTDYKFIHRCVVPGVGAVGVLLEKKSNSGLAKFEMLKICRAIAPEFRAMVEQ